MLYLLDKHKSALNILQYLIIVVSKEQFVKFVDEEIVVSVVDAVDYDYWLRSGNPRTDDLVQQRVNSMLNSGLLPVSVTLLESLF